MNPDSNEFSRIPLCTLSNRPRQSEHCIVYAMTVAWPEAFPDREPDMENREDTDWLHSKALAKAAEFNLPSFDKRKTEGVLKRIMPAVASTNSLISAACVNEAFKMLTWFGVLMENHTTVNIAQGVYTSTQRLKIMEGGDGDEKQEDCYLCKKRKEQQKKKEEKKREN
eukprot:Selendium_serpulae@DN4881_c0_g1_i3.p3